VAIQRYQRQRRLRDDKERRRQEELERRSRAQYNTSFLKRGMNHIYEDTSDSTSSEHSSEEEIEMPTESFIDESMKNDSTVLNQYANNIDSIIDLFDGQASTTSVSAATTIMVHAPKKIHRKGGVLHL